MRKVLLAVLTSCILAVMVTATQAMPTPPEGYTWVNAPLWTFTDTSTANSEFIIFLENASYESDFGLFTVNDPVNPTGIGSKLQVFSYTDEFFAIKTVNFRLDGGSYQAQINGIGDWIDFGREFGFYYDVHTGGAGDPTADYSYYTFNAFNSPPSQIGVDHILTAYNPLTKTSFIYLDDQLVPPTGISDRDFDDMTVRGNDLQPVPEPGTILLLGAGLLGLGFYGRRRMKKA